MGNRMLRTALILAVVLVTVVTLSVMTAHSASAQFGCFGTTEDFSGAWPNGGNPSNGWTMLNDSGGNVYWHRSDQAPTYGANQGSPISGLHAYAESYPLNCDDSAYATSLG